MRNDCQKRIGSARLLPRQARRPWGSSARGRSALVWVCPIIGHAFGSSCNDYGAYENWGLSHCSTSFRDDDPGHQNIDEKHPNVENGNRKIPTATMVISALRMTRRPKVNLQTTCLMAMSDSHMQKRLKPSRSCSMIRASDTTRSATNTHYYATWHLCIAASQTRLCLHYCFNDGGKLGDQSSLFGDKQTLVNGPNQSFEVYIGGAMPNWLTYMTSGCGLAHDEMTG